MQIPNILVIENALLLWETLASVSQCLSLSLSLCLSSVCLNFCFYRVMGCCSCCCCCCVLCCICNANAFVLFSCRRCQHDNDNNNNSNEYMLPLLLLLLNSSLFPYCGCHSACMCAPSISFQLFILLITIFHHFMHRCTGTVPYLHTHTPTNAIRGALNHEMQA